jgi:hypothetical protein
MGLEEHRTIELRIITRAERVDEVHKRLRRFIRSIPRPVARASRSPDAIARCSPHSSTWAAVASRRRTS